MEEEKIKIPTNKEMNEIIIEIKKDTKRIIKKINEEEKKNQENQENQENKYNLLYDPCVIKFLCFILLIAIWQLSNLLG